MAGVGAANRGVTALHYRQDGRYANTVALASDYNYTPSNLPGQVRKEVASSATFGTMYGQPEHATPSTTQPQQTVGVMSIPQMEGCMTRVAAGSTVLLADVARYLGTPAMIIVLKAATSFDVLVEGITCSASRADTIRRLTVPER